MEARLEACPMI